jgi:hypothetical protein
MFESLERNFYFRELLVINNLTFINSIREVPRAAMMREYTTKFSVSRRAVITATSQG